MSVIPGHYSGRRYKMTVIYSRTFLTCLVTGMVGAVIITSVNLMQFIAYYTDINNGDILQPYACKYYLLLQ